MAEPPEQAEFAFRRGVEVGKAEVAAKGGIDAVLTVMRRHEGVAAVAELGCAALQSISYSGGRRLGFTDCTRWGRYYVCKMPVACVCMCVAVCVCQFSAVRGGQRGGAGCARCGCVLACVRKRVWLFVCLSVCLSVWLCVCLCVSGGQHRGGAG